MPFHNNTLQTIPPELRNRIYHTLAATSTRVILGRKFLASRSLGEYAGVLTVQFTNAAALEPLSVTCRQLNLESAAMLLALPDPPAYHFLVNNFNLDQLDLFREYMDSQMLMNDSRKFVLKFQFDFGVLHSALELERRLILEKAKEKKDRVAVLRCEITKFMLVFALSRDSKVFGGGGNGDGGGGGGAGRAMTESQAREAVQVLRRVRNMIATANEENLTLGTICIRFEAMLDVHIARSKGNSSVWRGDGLPDAHPRAIALDRRDEAYRRFEAAKRLEEAERLEAAGRHGGAECLEAAARRLEEAKAATRLEFDNWKRLDLLRLPR